MILTPYILFQGEHDMIINTVCAGSSNDKVYSSGWDTKVVRWDVKSSQKISEYICQKGYINFMRFGENETTLILGGKGGLLEKISF